MRFNTKKYQELTQESICERTGLYPKSFQWIMSNGFSSEDAMERLAEAAGEGTVICAHIPTAWVRIAPPAVRELTEEQRKEIGKSYYSVARMLQMFANNITKSI